MVARLACVLLVLVFVLSGCSLDLTIPDRGVAGDASDGPGQLEGGPDGNVPVIISKTGKCDDGLHPVLLGGGGKCPTSNLSTTAKGSGGDKWTVTCSPTVEADVYALCGTPKLDSLLSAIPCESTVRASCVCPVKYQLYSIVPQPVGWKFTCNYSLTVTSPELATGGQCLENGTKTAQGTGTQAAEAPCPPGYYVVSGGCDHPGGSGTIRASYPANMSTWRCESSIFSASVLAYALCWKP